MEQDWHDLLIRIDERTGAMDKRLEKMELWSDILPCQRQTEKIQTLEKIAWTGVGASVVAMVKSFWA